MEKIGGNIAFIPLRANSKGIPGKNHKMLAGKPLFCHVVDAALASGVFQCVVLATDSETIKSIARQTYSTNPEVMVYDRSAENAQDHSSTESVMLEFAGKYDFDFISLVQATSPLTNAEDFSQAWHKFYNEQLDSLLTVVREKRFYWQENEDGTASATNYVPLHRPRRQDFDGTLVENGAFYVTNKKALLETQCRLSGKMGVHIMAPETAFEIDEPEDFAIIENLMHRRVKATAEEGAKKIKLVLTDVDGVLTDAGMYYTEEGDELKKFNTRDGKGFELLRNKGFKTGIITSEDTKLVARRAAKLKVDHLFQGTNQKLKLITELVGELGITLENVAYIGDDLNDLDLLKAVGLSFCPADAQPENKAVVKVILSKKGGGGCYREMAEFILGNHA